MVYIAPSGSVQESPPLLNRLSSILWEILNFIVLFFQTLIPGLSNGFTGTISSRSFRGSDGGGGGGGGGAGGLGGGRGFFRGRPPKPGRNIGRFSSMSDIPPPPSCSGCGCG